MFTGIGTHREISTKIINLKGHEVVELRLDNKRFFLFLEEVGGYCSDGLVPKEYQPLFLELGLQLASHKGAKELCNKVIMKVKEKNISLCSMGGEGRETKRERIFSAIQKAGLEEGIGHLLSVLVEGQIITNKSEDNQTALNIPLANSKGELCSSLSSGVRTHWIIAVSKGRN